MRNPWLTAVLAALVVTAGTGVALWLVKAPPIEIVKTSGVAGGAVVALYALWLNDRRRRVEEKRHDLESEKIADERFARSVELLGNDADQVRVGAMHSLEWLARSTPRYRQTVLDVLCAYLRRPFEHKAHEKLPGDPDQVLVEDRQDVLLEHQVRLTAQRLIKDLLSWRDMPEEEHEHYNLDLTGASLDYLSLDGRHVNRLVARRAQFYGITNLRNVHAIKPALFSGGTFHGRVQFENARFDGGVSFQEVTFLGLVELNATVGTFIHPSQQPPADLAGELKVLPGTAFRAPMPGWPLTGSTEAAGAGLQNHVEQDTGGGADRVTGGDHGLSDGYVPAKTDEVRAGRLDGEGLRD